MASFITDYKEARITGNINKDIAFLTAAIKDDSILRVRNLTPANSSCEFALLFLDGMVNSHFLSENVIKPLSLARLDNDNYISARDVSEKVLFASEVSLKTTVDEMLFTILSGDTLLLLSGSSTAICINTKGFPVRAIEEPVDERVTQGPREGFCEVAILNLALIRRRLINPDLRIKSLKTGKRSDTAVYICYLETLADNAIISELKKRLENIDIDGVLDSNYLTEHIRDGKYSLFKTVGTTERPDVVVGRLLEGRVAIIVDGTPMVLTVPYLFSENFQSDEDYYLNFFVASVRRFLRYICFVASVSVPAVFVALSTFHIELMPTHFAISVAELRMGVPISSVGECLLLVIVFEVLKEAGIRMSQSLGHALSIVGGLVVGQAAVEAKIISAPMLIAVAFSGISGLMVPRLKTSVLYVRIISVIICSLLGLYGFMMISALLLIYVLSIKSFGVDYTLSLRKINFQSLKDSVLRAPWTNMITRPPFSKDIKRSSGEKNG
ncbi:MAG: spore germination protein [Clostridia bacterium]|nr:spore germination protein [Clostridia bacterium]